MSKDIVKLLQEDTGEIARLIELDKRTNETVGMWIEKNQLLQTENTILSQQLLATQAALAQMTIAVKNAFYEGFFSMETYNDTQLNSEDEAFEKSQAKIDFSTPVNLDALQEALAQECERLANTIGLGDDRTWVRSWMNGEAGAHRSKKGK